MAVSLLHASMAETPVFVNDSTVDMDTIDMDIDMDIDLGPVQLPESTESAVSSRRSSWAFMSLVFDAHPAFSSCRLNRSYTTPPRL